MTSESKTLPLMARVEGEGALELFYREGKLEQLKLNIFEPPRYFERLLEGKDSQDLIDIVARICGICPVAYQLTAAQAIADAFEITWPARAMRLRRLLYCGEWIQSHALHVHLLALPDFLGVDNALQLGQSHPEILKNGLFLQAFGNRIMSTLAGRSVHPVGITPGGFARAPDGQKLDELKSDLPKAEAAAFDLLAFVLTLKWPEYGAEHLQFALRSEQGYAMEEGVLCSNRGHCLEKHMFKKHVSEVQKPYSTALWSFFGEECYLLGPLSRLNLNANQLDEDILNMIHSAGIGLPSYNIYHSLLARCAELAYCIRECGRILNEATGGIVHTSWQAKEAESYGWTEAPRGLLWHHYVFDDQGEIEKADIVPPTSQNQGRMEAELQTLIGKLVNDDMELLQKRAETMVRNFDPCISCATHFLNIKVHR